MNREVLGSLIYAYQATCPDLGCVITTLGSLLRILERYIETCSTVLKRNQGPAFEPAFDGLKTTRLLGYSDANWAGDFNSRRSTNGYVFSLGGNAIS